jgi:hypothetical protein
MGKIRDDIKYFPILGIYYQAVAFKYTPNPQAGLF